MILPYNPNLKSSIVEYGKKLKGHSLKSICNDEIINHTVSGKGNFGQLLEKYYFLYEPNSDENPDFPIAKIELKSSPLKTLKTKDYRSKERLVLNIINYHEIVKQDFYESSFWKKNASMLLVFYLHQVGADVLDYIIKIVDEWNFSSIDLEIIKKDWQTIKDKVTAGKAHELSEGDTYYLGACTKGGKGGSYRNQPNSSALAKQRAFSLKQGYVNHIIASLSDCKSEVYGKLIHSHEEARDSSIEDRVIEKFIQLIGKSDKELVELLGIDINSKAKSYYSKITKEIINSVFNVPSGRKVENYLEEFEKAEIIVKTVRLDENCMPEEDVSFPTFKYKELVNENWDESEVKSTFERKFFFVFFQIEKERLVLKEVKFWNMPYKDLIQVESVWQKTKDIVESGDIVARKYVTQSGKVIRKTNFPNKRFSHIAHVRPHAQNAMDTYPLPTQDKITNLLEYTKHCFWLNNSYVKDEIYLK